jgi:hypothetical protein
MLADSMTAVRLIIGNLGAFRFDGQLAATLYESSRARKSPAEGTVDKIMSPGSIIDYLRFFIFAMKPAQSQLF